jgi:hypothetical protein
LHCGTAVITKTLFVYLRLNFVSGILNIILVYEYELDLKIYTYDGTIDWRRNWLAVPGLVKSTEFCMCPLNKREHISCR